MKGKKHKPEQIIKKLREADAMLAAEKSIGQIALTYDFKNRPKAGDIFDSQFLPPAGERKL